MRMITAINEDTNLVQDVTTTSEGRLCVEQSPRYYDLGEIINDTIAAYAEVLAAPVDEIDWARHTILRTFWNGREEETCLLQYYRRDSNGDLDVSAVSLATIGGDLVFPTECNVVDTIVGYGAEFAVLNNGAYSATVSLSVQLLG
jgi:hypothetical protein